MINERLKSLLGFVFSLLAFVFSFYAMIYVQNHDAKVLIALLVIFLGLALCVTTSLLARSFNKKRFFPQYQIGDVVILSFKFHNGERSVQFTQFDDVISQIPKYFIKEIGPCSYLLTSTTDNSSREVKFKEHDCMFSIAEFKERARCC